MGCLLDELRAFGINADQWTTAAQEKGGAAELGRNPLSKHQIQLEYRDEQADAARDCHNRLARPDSQARPVQLTTRRIGNLYVFFLEGVFLPCDHC